MTLLLFDIDGTLVQKASKEHAEAIREAITEVHPTARHEQVRLPEVAGRTDGEIARLLLLGAGVPEHRIDERAADVRDAACRRYFELCPADLSDKVIPGIPGLLESLSGRDDVTLALVTGNYEPIARLKLKRAGVGHFFSGGQGGFGSDCEDRAALPPIARRRAGVAREQTVVIGDTPRDIACARADGLRCIAVTTGPYGEAELGAADAVCADADTLAQALTTFGLFPS